MNIVVIKNSERALIFCVTTKYFAKLLFKIFFLVTITLDTENGKKSHQSFEELKKPSTFRISDEISSSLRNSDEISSSSQYQE